VAADTKYEVACWSDSDPQRYHLGFTARKTKQGVAAVANQIRDLFDRLSLPDNPPEKWIAHPWRVHVGRWTIGFTGRTQHEAERSPYPGLP